MKTTSVHHTRLPHGTNSTRPPFKVISGVSYLDKRTGPGTIAVAIYIAHRSSEIIRQLTDSRFDGVDRGLFFTHDHCSSTQGKTSARSRYKVIYCTPHWAVGQRQKIQPLLFISPAGAAVKSTADPRTHYSVAKVTHRLTQQAKREGVAGLEIYGTQ